MTSVARPTGQKTRRREKITTPIAAPTLLLADAVGSLPMLPNSWRIADRRPVFTMSLGAMVGIPLGAFALSMVSPTQLRWAISLTILALVTLLASGWRYSGKATPPITVGVGALSGFLSGAAQIGGVPAIVYWLGGAFQAANVRANITVFFALSTIYSFIAYWVRDMLGWSALAHAIVVGPAYTAGILIGMKLFGFASQQTFRRICYGLIALAAVLGLPVFR